MCALRRLMAAPAYREAQPLEDGQMTAYRALLDWIAHAEFCEVEGAMHGILVYAEAQAALREWVERVV